MKKAEEVKYFRRNYEMKGAVANRWKERLLRLANYDHITIGDLMNKSIDQKYMLYGCNFFAKMIASDSVSNTGLCLGLIDRNAPNINTSLPIFTIDDIPEEILDEVEIIIICLTQKSIDLQKEVEEKTQKRIVWLEDILYEL